MNVTMIIELALEMTMRVVVLMNGVLLKKRK